MKRFTKILLSIITMGMLTFTANAMYPLNTVHADTLEQQFDKEDKVNKAHDKEIYEVYKKGRLDERKAHKSKQASKKEHEKIEDSIFIVIGKISGILLFFVIIIFGSIGWVNFTNSI